MNGEDVQLHKLGAYNYQTHRVFTKHTVFTKTNTSFRISKAESKDL